MRTALDTNILSALWSSEPEASRIAQQLEHAYAEGGLAHFRASVRGAGWHIRRPQSAS